MSTRKVLHEDSLPFADIRGNLRHIEGLGEIQMKPYG
jgi:hypothetical protein